jgi:hypothetical protein
VAGGWDEVHRARRDHEVVERRVVILEHRGGRPSLLGGEGWLALELSGGCAQPSFIKECTCKIEQPESCRRQRDEVACLAGRLPRSRSGAGR